MIPKNLSRDQDESFKKVRAEIVSTLKKYGIKKAGIFGSYAKGKQKKNSDVDILIEPVRGMGYEFVEIKLELEDVEKLRSWESSHLKTECPVNSR